MEDMGKSMFTCFVSCPFCVPCFRQLSVTEGFPDHCSMEWLSAKLGVSAIIPQTAAGYSILSKFHFLCAHCSCCSAALCCWFCPLLQIWDTRSRCVIWCIIEAMEYFVCVSAMMFAALAPVQMCRVIFVCLLSWLKQHCNHSTTYGRLLSCDWASWKCWSLLQPCAHVAHRRAEHQLTGA